MELLLPILFGCLMLNTLVGLILTNNALKLLRTRHPDIWASLGSPTLVAGNSPASSRAFLGFVWRKDDDGLADKDLATNCKRLRLNHILQGVILIAAILAVALKPGS